MTICIDRAGLVGDDGKTHQGIFDITYTRCVPEHDGRRAQDENELQHLLFTALESGKPFAIRYPEAWGSASSWNPGLRRCRSERRDSSRGQRPVPPGVRLDGRRALAAAEELASRGVSCGVANARFVKPLDLPLLDASPKASPRDPDPRGAPRRPGGSAAPSSRPSTRGRFRRSASKFHAIPDQFVEHSPQAVQRSNLKLDAAGVAERALELFPDLGTDPKEGSRGPRRREEKLAETVTW